MMLLGTKSPTAEGPAPTRSVRGVVESGGWRPTLATDGGCGRRRRPGGGKCLCCPQALGG